MNKTRIIPCRTAYALNTTLQTSAWVASWKRLYRQIFWLADGQRDAERIAELLHKSELLITQAVRELAVTGYISMRSDEKVLSMNVELLKQSFEMIASSKESFAQSFYQRLFSYYPQTQHLFAHTEMKRQQGSLMATLAVVIAGVERGDNLIPVLQQLGERHTRYHAKPEYYPLVGSVLLETFYEYLGSLFTDAMQDAWSQAFDLISIQMLVSSQMPENILADSRGVRAQDC